VSEAALELDGRTAPDPAFAMASRCACDYTGLNAPPATTGPPLIAAGAFCW